MPEAFPKRVERLARVASRSLPLGGALWFALIRCVSCGAREAFLEEYKDFDWKRVNGHWVCPDCAAKENDETQQTPLC